MREMSGVCRKEEKCVLNGKLKEKRPLPRPMRAQDKTK